MKLKAAPWRKRLAVNFTDEDDSSMIAVAEAWADAIEKIQPDKHETTLLNERLVFIGAFTPDIVFGAGEVWENLKNLEAKKLAKQESQKVKNRFPQMDNEYDRAKVYREDLIEKGWASPDYPIESACRVRSVAEMAAELASAVNLYEASKSSIDLAEWLWSPAGSPMRKHPEMPHISLENRYEEHAKLIGVPIDSVLKIATADLACYQTQTEILMQRQKEILEEAIRWRENIVHLMVAKPRKEKDSNRHEDRSKFRESLKNEALEWIRHECLVKQISACKSDNMDIAGFGILEAKYTKSAIWRWWEDAAQSIAMEEGEGATFDECAFWLMAGVSARARLWSFLWGAEGAAHALIGRAPHPISR